MFRIISIAFVALVLGGCTSTPKGWECYEGKYKKPTNLSGIKVGVSRADIDKLLGKPLAIRDVKNLTPPSHKTLAAYRYFGKPPASQRQGIGIGIPHYPTYMSVTEITREICPPAEKQDRHSIAIVYDGDDQVIRDDRMIIGDGWYPYGHPPYGPHGLALTVYDHEYRAYVFEAAPARTYDLFGFMPTRHQQDYWLCINAYNRHAWALKEMGHRHWQGENVPRQDKVLGYMWYSLATKSDPALADEQKDRRLSLTTAQLRKAEQLVANWLRKAKEQDWTWPFWPKGRCDALPNW